MARSSRLDKPLGLEVLTFPETAATGGSIIVMDVA